MRWEAILLPTKKIVNILYAFLSGEIVHLGFYEPDLGTHTNPCQSIIHMGMHSHKIGYYYKELPGMFKLFSM